MRLRSRTELKQLFQNDSRLSEQHFIALIDALLNKRDDKFHGVWQPGRTYCPGDVVIYDGALWIMAGEGEICATAEEPPSRDHPDWDSLIIPVDDDDWEVIVEEGVMWAKVFDKVGIGIGSDEGTGDRPAARLDVRKAEQGRWLLFPEAAADTLFTLLHEASTIERSYLTTALSLEEVTWLSDAAKGFVWRKGRVLSDAEEALELAPGDGQTLLVVKPKRLADGSELATLGLNVEDPAAMLDITDGSRGQLLFTPEEKADPALTIVNLGADAEQNYLALGVGRHEAALVSDAPNGFIFRRGGNYGDYCHEKNVNQGDLLMLVRQHPDAPRPQVGIGTDQPGARLEIKDAAAQVYLLPEMPAPETPEPDPDADPGSASDTDAAAAPSGDAIPAIALLRLPPEEPATYLTTGLGTAIAGWVTNAPQGFVFRQGGPAFVEANHHTLDQGQTWLAIREDGRIGLGTEDPYTRLEIVNPAVSGKFLFNLDQKVNPAIAILNLRPGSAENYFTIGADNNHAILVTDSQYGFLFKAGQALGTNDSQIDINQGQTLVSIRPEGRGRVGIGKQPMDYELDLHGMARTFTLYQDTHSGYMARTQPLANVLDRVRSLRPVTFQWNAASGFHGEGEQIGFLAHEVDDVFPQVVKTASDGSQAVAYQNLVPVLVQALKEVLAERDETRQQLTDLRNEFTAFRQQTRDRLEQLAARIRRAEDT